MNGRRGGEAGGPDVRRRAVLAMAGIAVALVLVGVFRDDIPGWLSAMLAWVERLGPWGPIAFIALYVVAAVLLVPASVLTLGAGALFGVAKGTLLVSAASTLGATFAFLVGRHLARDWVAGRIRAHPNFAAVEAAVAREGWKVVGLTRLSPAFPFNFLNYAFSFTSVRLRDFVLASWIGMLPGTVLYVYLGSLGTAAASPEDRPRTLAEWSFYAGGLIATIVVTIHITRLARRALEQRLDEGETHRPGARDLADPAEPSP